MIDISLLENKGMKGIFFPVLRKGGKKVFLLRLFKSCKI